MNYRGSYRRLLGNSRAAMMAAIEVYNKPMFEYRNECMVILLMNAWELALKSLLSKNKQSVFYPKQRNQPYRTLSWQDALSRSQKYFPKEIPHLPIQRNLELLGTYRNNAVHFYNAEGFSVVLYALAQTSIINFRDLLDRSFNVDLSSAFNWSLLPIGIQPPIDPLTYLSGQYHRKASQAVDHFLGELAKAVEEIRSAEIDEGRLMTMFNVRLESVKKIDAADIVVAVSGGDGNGGPLAIVKTQDPNKTHPLRQTEVLERLPTLHGDRFTQYKFQAVVWKYGIKQESRYCWQSSTGEVTRYSFELVEYIRRLTVADINACLTDYRQHIRSLRKLRNK